MRIPKDRASTRRVSDRYLQPDQRDCFSVTWDRTAA